MARSMLLHANRRWPEAVTANLWPYAIRQANKAINATPSFQDEQRRSPMEVFSGTKVATNPKHWKPFGCPVYVLDNELQGNKPFHKWKDRADIGIYLGMSPHHGRNIALVLSRTTGLVSPQFHVKFDVNFDTVRQIKVKSQWQLKTGFVHDQKVNKQSAKKKSKSGSSIPPEGGETRNAGGIRAPEGAPRRSRKRKRLPGQDGNPGSRGKQRREPAAANVGNDGSPTPHAMSGNHDGETDQRPRVTTRSGQQSKPVQRLLQALTSEIETCTSNDVPGEIFCLAAMFPDDDYYEYEDTLLAYKATSDPDTMYYHQAMKEPDRDKFSDAMLKEIVDQYNNGNFTVVPKSKILRDKVILPAVWQMKRKREVLTGNIKKYKARLNVDGSRMRKGVHYDQTYSPVASWNSTRVKK